MINRQSVFPAIAGIFACILLPSLAQETIMEQNFNQVPVDFIGRLGAADRLEGRWAEFGDSPGTPRIQSQTAREGNAVELTRLPDSDGRHALHGIFTPITHAHRILLNCHLRLGENSGTIVALARQNDLAAGLTLYSRNPGIRGWNHTAQKWEVISNSPVSNEWCRVEIDCNIEAATYQAAVFGEDGAEIARQEFSFDTSLLDEGGIGVLLINPQLPDSFFLDDVTLQVER